METNVFTLMEDFTDAVKGVLKITPFLKAEFQVIFILYFVDFITVSETFFPIFVDNYEGVCL